MTATADGVRAEDVLRVTARAFIRRRSGGTRNAPDAEDLVQETFAVGGGVSPRPGAGGPDPGIQGRPIGAATCPAAGWL